MGQKETHRGFVLMDSILGIDIHILILFLLVSICIGIYLNLMVFDRMATLTQDTHDVLSGVRDIFQNIVHVGQYPATEEEKETILFEDGWP